MRKIYVVMLLALAGLSSGCGTTIKYGFDKNLYKYSGNPILTAAVNEFEDLRTQDEHDGTFSTTKDYFYTQDKLFKKNIGQQQTAALVKHFKKANLFTKVEAVALGHISAQDIQLPETAGLEGYDVLIAGDLYHFYGYRSGKTSSHIANMFGVAGVLMEAMANKKVVGGRATLGDVVIYDLRSMAVLWEGDLDYDFERTDTFYADAQGYAIEALKNVNDKLARKIAEVLYGY